MILALPPPTGKYFYGAICTGEETRAIAEHYGSPDAATVRIRLARASAKSCVLC